MPSTHSHADALIISDGIADPGTVRVSLLDSDQDQQDSTLSADTNLSTPNALQLRSQEDGCIPQVSDDISLFRYPATSSGHARGQHYPQVRDTSPSSALYCSQPIAISLVNTLLARRDPNCVPTPLSGRGDRKGHFFPFTKTSSPHDNTTIPSKKKGYSSPESGEFCQTSSRGRRKSSSSSTRSHYNFSMQMESRYTPTSPLSPKLSGSNRLLSPQPTKPRTNHARQLSRNLPRYHPSNFGHGAAAGPSSTVQSPAITLNRVNQPIHLESPRMMREMHREFLNSVRLTSKTAASPFSQKPGSPRLHPLGSPKGPVTPLALEEASDYFAVAGTGKRSPTCSPGAPSACSDASSGKEDTVKNERKVDVYQ